MRLVFTFLFVLIFAASAQAFPFFPGKKKEATGDNTPPVPKREINVKPVARMTPDFTFPGEGGRTRTLKSLRGQPVVVVLADTPANRAYRKQIALLEPLYSDFAARRAIFIAAYTKEGSGPVKSNVPFVVANNGPAVAAAFGATERFAVIVIGPDGNVDYQTTKPVSGPRVRDVMQNSFTVQKTNRKTGGG